MEKGSGNQQSGEDEGRRHNPQWLYMMSNLCVALRLVARNLQSEGAQG